MHTFTTFSMISVLKTAKVKDSSNSSCCVLITIVWIRIGMHAPSFISYSAVTCVCVCVRERERERERGERNNTGANGLC